MIIAMIAIAALVVGLCVYIGYVQTARRRTPLELRGDWWTGFEREFRAYAQETSKRRRTRRPQGPATPPPAV